MNFLFVVPMYKERAGEFYDFPLGLSYVSSVLKTNGHHVEVLNLNHRNDSVSVLLEDALKSNAFDALCTGGLSVHYLKIKEILRLAKSYQPDLVTIVGGGLITSEPELLIRDLPIDFGIIEEGENTILELARVLETGSDPAAVDGLMFQRGGEIVKTTPRSPIDDLSQIPFPDYEGFEIRHYLDHQLPSDGYHMYPYDKPRAFPIITSRSCPYHCTFCFHPIGQKYRRRPLDDFFRELDLLMERYGVNLLAIIDETLAVAKGRVLEFCERIKPRQIPWMTQLRVTAVDEEILEALKGAGCYYISYGIESANNDILRSMKKFITIEQIEKALELTYQYQIGIQGNFLFSDPAETFETACQTVDWWLAHPKYNLHLNTLVPYPGSEDYRYALEKGIIRDRLAYLAGGCKVFNLSRMPDEKFQKLCNFLVETRLNPKYYHFAQDVTVEPMGYSEVRGCELVRLQFRCNHCHTLNLYENYTGNVPIYIKQACRHCNQRSDISAEKFPMYKNKSESKA